MPPQMGLEPRTPLTLVGCSDHLSYPGSPVLTVVGIGSITHFYCLAVEAGFYSDMVECLPLDPAAQVQFPLWAVGIFLRPVTFGGQYVGSTASVSGITQQEMSRNNSVVPTRFGDESI